MSLSISDTQLNNAMPCAECRYAECHVLFTIMLSVIMLNVVMVNVVMLNVVMLNVVMLNVIMLNVVMLNVIILSVVAPFIEWSLWLFFGIGFGRYRPLRQRYLGLCLFSFPSKFKRIKLN